jgi:hypothetical protein
VSKETRVRIRILIAIIFSLAAVALAQDIKFNLPGLNLSSLPALTADQRIARLEQQVSTLQDRVKQLEADRMLRFRPLDETGTRP